MQVLCNLTTKKVESFSRWDDFDFNPDTHIVLVVADMPDMKLDRLNDTNDGIRGPLQSELDAITNEQRIADIKDEAQARIIAQLPEGSPDNFIIKQMNLMMLNAELDDIVINGGTLTTEQAAMKASFIQLKDNIKAIRSMSDIAEASGHSLDKFKSDLDLAGL